MILSLLRFSFLYTFITVTIIPYHPCFGLSPWLSFRNNVQNQGLSNNIGPSLGWTLWNVQTSFPDPAYSSSSPGVTSSPVIGSDATVYFSAYDGFIYDFSSSVITLGDKFKVRNQNGKDDSLFSVLEHFFKPSAKLVANVQKHPINDLASSL